MSAPQLHRMLGVACKTAWFMANRIREDMADRRARPLGGEGKVVEEDETHFGSKDVVTNRTKRGKSGHGSNRAVVALVERGTRGVYQHSGEKHLHRYLAEFDFRYNARVAFGVNEAARANKALRGVAGKRLTYRTADRG